MDKLNTELKEKAIAVGLCEQWQSEWTKSWTPKKMVEKYFEGINFCAENHYPDKEFIKQAFERKFLRKNNVLVDDEYSLLNPEQAMIMGTSKSNIRFNGTTLGRIHVQGDSDVKVYAKNRCHVMLHVWDKAQVKIETEDRATVIVIRHSPDTVVIAEKDIRIWEAYNESQS